MQNLIYSLACFLALTALTSPLAQAQCGDEIVYLTPGGATSGTCGPTNPCNFEYGFSQFSATRPHIRLSTGTYNVADIVLNDGWVITVAGALIEGGFEYSGAPNHTWRKSSTGVSTIYRSSANFSLLTPVNAQTGHIFGMRIEADNVVVKDLNVTVEAATGQHNSRGISTYGIHVSRVSGNPTGIYLSRLTLNVGSASRGANGTGTQTGCFTRGTRCSNPADPFSSGCPYQIGYQWGQDPDDDRAARFYQPGNQGASCGAGTTGGFGGGGVFGIYSYDLANNVGALKMADINPSVGAPGEGGYGGGTPTGAQDGNDGEQRWTFYTDANANNFSGAGRNVDAGFNTVRQQWLSTNAGMTAFENDYVPWMRGQWNPAGPSPAFSTAALYPPYTMRDANRRVVPQNGTVRVFNDSARKFCTNSYIRMTKTSVDDWNMTSAYNTLALGGVDGDQIVFYDDLASNTTSFGNSNNDVAVYVTGTGHHTFRVGTAHFLRFLTVTQTRPLPSITTVAIVGDSCPRNRLRIVASSSETVERWEFVVYPTAGGSPYAPTYFAIRDGNLNNIDTTTNLPANGYTIRLRSYTSCCGWSRPVFSNFTITSSGNTTTWTGLTNDWGALTNWNNGIPTCGCDAVIPNTAVPNEPLISGVANCNILTIQANRTLTLAPGATLNICEGLELTAASSRMNADNGIVRYVNDGVTGYYQANVNIAEADMDINHLVLAGDDVRLDSRMFITSGVTPRLEFATTGGTRRLNTNGSPLHLGAGIQVINPYTGTSTAAIQERHIIATSAAGAVHQRLGLATGPYTLPIGNAASAQPMFMQFSTIPALEIDEVRVWFTTTAPPTLNTGDLCGANSIIGYGGRFHHDAYNGATPVHSLATVRYGLTIHPHNFTPPPGATDFTLMQQHSAAASSPFGTDWHAVRSNTIGWGGNPECVVSSAATAISTDVNIAYFSVSGAGAASTPFPVDFNELKAQAVGDQILLNWSTQGERNLSHFVVERIAQGMLGAPSFFTDLTQVAAAPPSQGYNHSYSYTDVDVVPFQPYLYRLRITDFDGYSKYSNIVSAMTTDGGSQTQLTIYPNPSNGSEVTTRFSIYQPSFVTLMLLDATGREVLRIYEGELKVGQYNFSFPTDSLAQGLYHLQMVGDGVRLASPLVIGSR